MGQGVVSGAGDREDAVRLAFLVLSKDGQRDVITSTNVRETLQLVRPHYNPLKVCRCSDDLRAHHICDDSKMPDHISLTSNMLADQSAYGNCGSVQPANYRLSNLSDEDSASSECVNSHVS